MEHRAHEAAFMIGSLLTGSSSRHSYSDFSHISGSQLFQCRTTPAKRLRSATRPVSSHARHVSAMFMTSDPESKPKADVGGDDSYLIGGCFRGGGGDDNDGNDGDNLTLVSGAVGVGAVQSVPERRKRVMMLMSDTGGGHRASSQALKAAMDDMYPDKIDVAIVDVFTELSSYPFKMIPQQYSFLAKYPVLWRFTYAYGRFWPTRQLTQLFYNFLNMKRMEKAFLEFKPDMVISVHPLCQSLPLTVLKNLRMRDHVSFVTVVTDLGEAHPTWFHPGVDLCFVPTKKLWDAARRRKLKSTQLRLLGLPTRPAFWGETASKQLLRKKLGLRLNTPAILVVGGGDGVGGLYKVARAVAKRAAAQQGAQGAQLVIICGKNENLRQRMLFRKWPVPVKITGFVTNMNEYMVACDCIITKAGPGTIAESLICGLPIVLSGYLPGQEYGNVKFVLESGVGDFARTPDRIADIIARLLRDRKLLQSMSTRAKETGRPKATYDIARDIGELLFRQRADSIEPSDLEERGRRALLQ